MTQQVSLSKSLSKVLSRLLMIMCLAFGVGAAINTEAYAQSTWTPPAGTGGWCTWTPGNGTACYADATSACARQHSDIGGPGQFYGASPSTTWGSAGCNWEYVFGYSRPGGVSFTCMSGYSDAPGLCEGEPYPLDCSCGTSSPTTQHPINPLTGAKRFKASDFASADGALVIDRTFVSRPYSGQGPYHYFGRK